MPEGIVIAALSFLLQAKRPICPRFFVQQAAQYRYHLGRVAWWNHLHGCLRALSGQAGGGFRDFWQRDAVLSQAGQCQYGSSHGCDQSTLVVILTVAE